MPPAAIASEFRALGVCSGNGLLDDGDDHCTGVIKL